MTVPKLVPIVGPPGYFAGEDGYIWSTRPLRGRVAPEPRRLNGRPDSDGYRMIDLYDGHGGHITRKVATLICTAYHGPKPEGMEVLHGSPSRTDNRPENLCWGTHRQNILDTVHRDGTAYFCLGHPPRTKQVVA